MGRNDDVESAGPCRCKATLVIMLLRDAAQDKAKAYLAASPKREQP